ncbi:FAD/NAD(P)-binding domain-containing protein [Saccharata proteae CBS 121410]|uniref:FAD/NAD(P)-binding domain-containing protein n=1 Tax=Saccharata proteae CBS 121410 TaxID=1314787 RepID=A0A9P4LSM3_9PEZI|nr:FAD/NAD(P)-binding domain-containing protein [Saccharata proteae CBS 121410]
MRRVLISGAGIAGPSLAWFLARTGARVTIIEKCQSLRAQGQNVDINGSALTVIKKMGLMPQVERWHTTEKGTQFIDPKGRPFAPLPVKKDGSASPTSEFEILRGDLAQVLYEATKDHPNIEYVFGKTISKILENSDDRPVNVELSDGSIQETDLLVAADGQWSNVRKQCFPKTDITVIDKGMYVAYWTVPRLPTDNDWWNVYHALGSRIVTTRPDPHGTTRAMLSKMPCNAAQKEAWQNASRGDVEMQKKLLREEFADVGWEASRFLDEMDRAPDFYFQAIQQIKMKSWSSGRVVCIGDAAFAPTPLTGMGTSLAIVGSYVLAGEISKLDDNNLSPSTALKAYEKAFRPFVEETQEISSLVPGIAHPATPLKRWFLQNVLLTTFAKVAATPWIVKRLDHNNNEEDFPLPVYRKFGDASVAAAA